MTLTKEAQEQIAPWSGGPRFLVIPFGRALAINIEGIASLLSGLFYRVQYAQTEHGTVFEETFRAAVKAQGNTLERSGVITSPTGEKREIDVSVRIDDELVLLECRSIERPLDYEIGRPKTFEKRQEFLSEKVDQVLSLREFVLKYPSGPNYDLTWAKVVSAIVVSPFVEWIWDLSPRLWLDESTPRIMQANHALEWLEQRK